MDNCNTTSQCNDTQARALGEATALWSCCTVRANKGNGHTGLLYALASVVLVVLLALPVISKMGNSDSEGGTSGAAAESNTQTQTYQDPVDPSEWRTDYENMLAHAKATGQVLLIYIHNEGVEDGTVTKIKVFGKEEEQSIQIHSNASKVCKIIEKKVFGDEEVQRKIKNCLKVKVHVLEQGIIEMNEGASAGSLVIYNSPRHNPPKYEVLPLWVEPNDIPEILFHLDILIPS